MINIAGCNVALTVPRRLTSDWVPAHLRDRTSAGPAILKDHSAPPRLHGKVVTLKAILAEPCSTTSLLDGMKPLNWISIFKRKFSAGLKSGLVYGTEANFEPFYVTFGRHIQQYGDGCAPTLQLLDLLLLRWVVSRKLRHVHSCLMPALIHIKLMDKIGND